jgi:hypothetical protein
MLPMCLAIRKKRFWLTIPLSTRTTLQGRIVHGTFERLGGITKFFVPFARPRGNWHRRIPAKSRTSRNPKKSWAGVRKLAGNCINETSRGSVMRIRNTNMRRSAKTHWRFFAATLLATAVASSGCTSSQNCPPNQAYPGYPGYPGYPQNYTLPSGTTVPTVGVPPVGTPVAGQPVMGQPMMGQPPMYGQPMPGGVPTYPTMAPGQPIPPGYGTQPR